MSFTTRLSNGWVLFKQSLEIINKEKTLLLFPIFSTTSLVLILASFFGGTFYFAGDEIESLLDRDQNGNILAYGLIFLYYLVNFFIIVFFNIALIHCAIKVLNDEPTDLSDGLSFAFSRIGKIFAWSVLSATVGTLMQALQNTGKIGQIIAGLFGIAWSILTFFVVPVLAYEDRGVLESVKESGRLMKEKWGESLAANVSFGVLHLLGFLAAILLFVLLASINIILAIIVSVGIVLVVSTVVSAARTVFVAAVYNHVTGKPVGNFDGDMLDSVFIQN
ncbi:MAG: hypothetical protein IPH12_08405 [Saprospirales bacterium]|nr:hypothetical protein [Saprospirales bacterium]MBK8920849.1 hypothetical protein [Saprospirales bacterium]